MQWKRKKRKQYIGKNTSSATAMLSTPLQTDTSSSKWYRSISELQLSQFIRVTVDENIYALVISGKPSDEDLIEAWGQIQLQYADAMKDNEYKLLVSLMKEVHRISILYDSIHMAIAELRKRYVKQFADRLNRWLESSFKFDVRFPDDYEEDLKRAYNRSKGIKLDLDLKRASYEAIQKKFSSAGNKLTREYFQGILITLSDHVRYPVTDSVTVFEYCDRIRRLNDHLKMAKQNGRRTHR